MTVNELIDALKQFDGSMEVFVSDDGDICDVIASKHLLSNYKWKYGTYPDYHITGEGETSGGPYDAIVLSGDAEESS